MSEWIWIDPEAVEAIHDRQLAEHGGPSGVRDRGALQSALARARNLDSYGTPDAADLAAAHAFGIVRNHPFVDGNKRTGWILARLFLALNGVQIEFDQADAVRTMVALAAGDIAEAELAGWLRDRVRSS